MSISIPPALVFGILCSAGFASLYHLWGGRNLHDLLVYLVSAGIGFAIGQAISAVTDINLLQIGQTHMIEASIGAWLSMVIARSFMV